MNDDEKATVFEEAMRRKWNNPAALKKVITGKAGERTAEKAAALAKKGLSEKDIADVFQTPAMADSPPIPCPKAPPWPPADLYEALTGQRLPESSSGMAMFKLLLEAGADNKQLETVYTKKNIYQNKYR